MMSKRGVILAFIFLVLLTDAYSVNQVKKIHRQSKGEARIINGEVAEKHEFPWMAMIDDPLEKEPGCGATLISRRYLLTAAHCFNGRSIDRVLNLHVLLGLHNYTWSADPDVVDIPFRRIIIYPDFKPNHYHDFALIELAQDVELSDRIKPICLPPMNVDFTNERATVIGWGLTHRGGNKFSDLLRKVEIPVVNQEYCQNIYDPSPILDDMLCAGTFGKDSCVYDSGNPLMWKDKTGIWRLIGVVSWGRGCATIYPGVYSRVTSVLPWILDTIGDDYC